MAEQGQAARRPPAEAAYEDIRRQLERVLAGSSFRTSRRCQELLRFLVDMTLEGRAAELKERTIGMEVFARSSSYDPSVDSTVRVKTGDVRRRLSQHYAQMTSEDRVIIELPAGSYVPHFKPASAGFVSGAPDGSRHQPWRWLLAAALIVAVASAAFLWRGPANSNPVLRQFWGPTLRSGSPVLLCLSYVPVYGLQPSLEASGKAPSTPRDFVPRPDKFIGASDSIAAENVEAVLARFGGRHLLKIGNDVSFHDLRSSPSVLIGYSYTRWSGLSGDLRFAIQFSQWPRGISDGGKPTAWVVPDSKLAEEDYALVARVFHPETGNMMVLLAGIEGYGTEAASDLVTNENTLAEAVRDAPSGWERRNLEFVIYVRVISGVAAAPRVVARHFW